jgi:hypothetical protein
MGGRGETVVTRSELPASAVLLVQELLDERRQVWCDLAFIDERTWAIRGSIAYEGDVILAEFDTRELAELALELLVTARGSTYTLMRAARDDPPQEGLPDVGAC